MEWLLIAVAAAAILWFKDYGKKFGFDFLLHSPKQGTAVPFRPGKNI